MSGDGRISTCEISRGSLSEGAYLAQIVRLIGDRQRVVILGPSSVGWPSNASTSQCSNVLIGWSTPSRRVQSHRKSWSTGCARWLTTEVGKVIVAAIWPEAI